MTRRTIEIAAFLAALLLTACTFHAWLTSHDDQQRLQATLSAQQKIIASADAKERARSASLTDALAQIDKLKRASQTPQKIVTALQDYLSLPRPLMLTNSNLKPPAAATHGKPGTTQKGTAISSVPHPSVLSSGGPANNVSGASDPVTQLRPRRAVSDPTVPFVDDCPTRPSCGTNPSPANPTLPSSISSADQSVTDAHGACPGSTDCIAQIPSADLKPLYNYVQDCRECQLRLASANQNLADDAKKIAALTAERDAAITVAKGGTLWRRVRRNVFWFAIGAATATAYSAKH